MSIAVQKNVPLSTYTTLKVGGTADVFATASTEESLVEAVAYAKDNDLRVSILGGGSNTLASDEGVRGLVLHNQIKGVQHEISGTQVQLTAGAGEILDDVIAYTVEEGWWGLENLSHIPGTVGAAPVQNVGAYGVEIKDVLSSVRVFDMEAGAFKTLTAQECQFGYRDSFFKTQEGKRYVITQVTFILSTLPHPQIAYKDLAATFAEHNPTQREIREAVMKIRSRKFPNWNVIGTAGSFFKNPFITKEAFADLKKTHPDLPGYETEEMIKIPLGWILDKALDLRGFQRGNVATYKDQALVLVAYEGATAEEIKKFADEIVDRIRTEIGITVEWEVTQMR